MCKTCGCGADGTLQLLLQVREKSEPLAIQSLIVRLMGATGVLHVKEETAGQLLVDFIPRQNARQDIEQVVAEAGFELLGFEERQLEHKHGVVPFLKRMLGRR